MLEILRLGVVIVVGLSLFVATTGAATGKEHPLPKQVMLAEIQAEFTTTYWKNPFSGRCFVNWTDHDKVFNFAPIDCKIYEEILRNTGV